MDFTSGSKERNLFSISTLQIMLQRITLSHSIFYVHYTFCCLMKYIIPFYKALKFIHLKLYIFNAILFLYLEILLMGLESVFLIPYY